MIKAVLLNDTRVDRHHGCTSVIETIDRLSYRNGIEIIARAPAHLDWRKNFSTMNAIDHSDLILVNGEGSIHHDRHAGRALLAAGAWARRRGKIAVLINATWQGNGPDSLAALRDFHIISVRESASLAELARHGINATRVPDLALFHEPKVPQQRSGIGYTDSVIGPTALSLYRRMWHFNAIPLPIVIIPFEPVAVMRWARRYGKKKSDLLSPTRLALALRATFQDCRHQLRDRDEFTTQVANREMIVTGRFHMLIFCLAARTPMLVLSSNTFKNEATLADAKLAPWRIVADPSLIDRPLLEKASRWHGREPENLEHFLASGRAAAETLFVEIAATVRR